MYKFVIKGQIVGITQDLNFLQSEQKIYGGEIKPYVEIKNNGDNLQNPRQTRQRTICPKLDKVLDPEQT